MKVKDLLSFLSKHDPESDIQILDEDNEFVRIRRISECTRSKIFFPHIIAPEEGDQKDQSIVMIDIER